MTQAIEEKNRPSCWRPSKRFSTRRTTPLRSVSSGELDRGGYRAPRSGRCTGFREDVTTLGPEVPSFDPCGRLLPASGR
jgi:hypothetical protein